MFGKNFDFESSHDSPNRARERRVKHYQDLASQAMRTHSFQQAIYFFLLAFQSSDLPNVLIRAKREGSSSSKRDAQGYISTLKHQNVLENENVHIIEGLKKAFDLAVKLHDRALAEHVFSFLEPFEDAQAANRAAQKLQNMALDRLEEYGLARDAMKKASDEVLNQIEKASPHAAVSHSQTAAKDGAKDTSASSMTKDIKAALPTDGKPSDIPAHRTASKDAEHKLDQVISALSNEDSDDSDAKEEKETYATIAGFNRAIKKMKEFGIGVDEDPKLRGFMHMLAIRHGVSYPVHTSSIIFRAQAPEDAEHFMAATANELEHPVIHMFMTHSPQGDPLLCTEATEDLMSDDALVKTGTLNHGTVVLDSIDTWGVPLLPDSDDEDAARFSHGARAAIEFIRMAVENPHVSVLASCSGDGKLDDFFSDLLSPAHIVDIKVPNASEREDLWRDIFAHHPSLRKLDISRLVALTKHMSRADIYHAADEAINQAYDESVAHHTYISVSFENLANKIAAYQPITSKEYKEIEDEAVKQLRLDIDTYDAHATSKKDISDMPDKENNDTIKGSNNGNNS